MVRLYVATTFGRVREGSGGKLIRLKEGLAPVELPAFPWSRGIAPSVGSLLENSRGEIWVGSQGAGLLRWEQNDGWQPFVPGGMPLQVFVNCLAQDETGAVWAGFGRSDQLAQIRPRPVETLPLPELGEPTRIYAVCAAQDGSMWVGTSDSGVFRFQDGRFRHFGAEDGLGSDRVSVILEGRRTNLWVGTSGGVFRLEGERFEAAQAGNFSCLYEDRQGVLCAGTMSATVIRMDRSQASGRTYTGGDAQRSPHRSPKPRPCPPALPRSGPARNSASAPASLGRAPRAPTSWETTAAHLPNAPGTATRPMSPAWRPSRRRWTDARRPSADSCQPHSSQTARAHSRRIHCQN
jgi:ligand-binding sensor domain-containing protein